MTLAAGIFGVGQGRVSQDDRWRRYRDARPAYPKAAYSVTDPNHQQGNRILAEDLRRGVAEPSRDAGAPGER